MTKHVERNKSYQILRNMFQNSKSSWYALSAKRSEGHFLNEKKRSLIKSIFIQSYSYTRRTIVVYTCMLLYITTTVHYFIQSDNNTCRTIVVYTCMLLYITTTVQYNYPIICGCYFIDCNRYLSRGGCNGANSITSGKLWSFPWWAVRSSVHHSSRVIYINVNNGF